VAAKFLLQRWKQVKNAQQRIPVKRDKSNIPGNFYQQNIKVSLLLCKCTGT
jgi:hypothetical protein